MKTSFLDFIVKRGVLPKEQKNVWSNYLDHELRQVLIKTNALSESTVKYLWSEFVWRRGDYNDEESS